MRLALPKVTPHFSSVSPQGDSGSGPRYLLVWDNQQASKLAVYGSTMRFSESHSQRRNSTKTRVLRHAAQSGRFLHKTLDMPGCSGHQPPLRAVSGLRIGLDAVRVEQTVGSERQSSLARTPDRPLAAIAAAYIPSRLCQSPSSCRWRCHPSRHSRRYRLTPSTFRRQAASPRKPLNAGVHRRYLRPKRAHLGSCDRILRCHRCGASERGAS